MEAAEVDYGERGIVALLPELLGCAAKLPLETADEVGGGGKLAFVGNLFCEQIGVYEQLSRQAKPLFELPLVGRESVGFGEFAPEGGLTYFALFQHLGF